MKQDTKKSLCLKLGSDVYFHNDIKEQALAFLEMFKPSAAKDEITEIPLLHEENAATQSLAPRLIGHQQFTQYSAPSRFLEGPIKDWTFEMHYRGWQFFFMRLLLIPPGFHIPVHTDEVEFAGERQSFRFHHTLVGDDLAPMTWHTDQGTVDVILKEGRSPYLVRVDLPHESVNRSKDWRIHLVASLVRVPEAIGPKLSSMNALAPSIMKMGEGLG